MERVLKELTVEKPDKQHLRCVSKANINDDKLC